jgi:transposase InsO family protein
MEGRLEPGSISAVTGRRLLAAHGLNRTAMRDGGGDKVRLRWQADRPGALWHADVCHGPALIESSKLRPVRVHALLDDASRYVVAIEARDSEGEEDMLALLVRALRREPPPDAIYLDNAPTYRGDALRIACERLGITLIHAKPYDAAARGKMERFWRTLREGCLDFCGSLGSLHDLNVRLFAWVDEHYHSSAHAALMGKSPAALYTEAESVRRMDMLDEARLRAALTVRARRRVRRDNTLDVGGRTWETSLGFLATRIVTVGRTLVDPDSAPWIEHESKIHPLVPVDPLRNASRARRSTPARPLAKTTDFDPTKALLNKALGRRWKQVQK